MKKKNNIILTKVLLNFILITLTVFIVELIPMLLITLKWNNLAVYQELSMRTLAPTTILILLVVGSSIQFMVEYIFNRVFKG